MYKVYVLKSGFRRRGPRAGMYVQEGGPVISLQVLAWLCIYTEVLEMRGALSGRDYVQFLFRPWSSIEPCPSTLVAFYPETVTCAWGTDIRTRLSKFTSFVQKKDDELVS